MKDEGGSVQRLKIRRFYCRQCGNLHNELPDCILPYKHYRTEVVSGVIEGVVTSNDLESEDYPCADTMALWLEWFNRNLQRIEGYLRRAAELLWDGSAQSFSVPASLLAHLRDNHPDWLEQATRAIYNSGGFLVPFYH